jgi:hypothetical protein
VGKTPTNKTKTMSYKKFLVAASGDTDVENCDERKIKKSQYLKQWREKNKDKVLLYNKDWRSKNKSRTSATAKDWRKRNQEKCREYKKTYQKKKLISDPLFAVQRRLRRRVALAFSSKGYTKRSKMQHIIGCDWQHLMDYIQSLFAGGMNWDNRNMWHIDHIIPLSSAKSEEEIIRLNHFTNLQPLWAFDNRRKGNKINQTEQ